MNDPTRVTRGSALILNIGPRVLVLAVELARSSSAPAFIERNLKMRNGLPPRPMRSWRKKTGPRESSLMAIAVDDQQRRATRQHDAADDRSKTRFTNMLKRPSSTGPTSSSGMPSMSSTPARVLTTSKRRGTMLTLTP